MHQYELADPVVQALVNLICQVSGWLAEMTQDPTNV